MAKKISVVFCGLIRRPAYLQEAIVRLVALRRSGMVGEIVVSTWAGEINRYPGMRRYLDENGVVVVEVAPVADKAVSVGNVERQILLLHWGLSALGDSTDYVFKTRPDQPINLFPRLDQLFAGMIGRIGARDDEDGALWVGRFHSLMPFFIDDRYFFGHRRTVDRMTVFSNELLLTGHPRNLMAEIIWHSAYFLRKFPLLRTMMQLDWSPPWPGGDFYPVLNKMRHQPLFRQGLALYYHVIATYYRVGLDGIGEQDFAGIEPPPLAVEIPSSLAYEAGCQQAVLDYFELRDEFDRMGALGPSPFPGEPGRAFDAADAALLDEGKFVSRPRVLRPGGTDTDRLATRPGDRVGHLPDGAVIAFDKIALAARCARESSRRSLTEIRVIVTNAGLVPLPSTKEHPLKLGYKWYLGGEPVWEEFPRIVIPEEVVSTSEISFGTLTPPRPGLYEIEVDLMYDGLFWFQCPSRAIMVVT
ncbi:MAG: hypothetical protein ACRYHQ_10530 [Janthinobacterium lividum]